MERKSAIGRVYGTITIIKELPDLACGIDKPRIKRRVLGKCECGSIKEYWLDSLGTYKSCGCLTASLIILQHGTHLQSKTRLYRIWRSMKTRCYYKKHKEFYLYGGKGIIVCADWNNSFVNFMDWALANGYEEHLSLDRRKSSKNYTPENCRWATPKQQANNTNKNKRYLYKGERLTASELEDKYGVTKDMVSQRIGRGWSVNEAVEIPKLQIGNPKNRKNDFPIHLRKANLKQL